MERPFTDKDSKPTQEGLQGVFGDTFPLYQTLMHITGKFHRSWTFSKSSGWMLKIHDAKKALLYLIPLQQGFKISMAIREKEKETLMKDDSFAKVNEMLAVSKKVSEGYPLYFNVNNGESFKPIPPLIQKIITLH